MKNMIVKGLIAVVSTVMLISCNVIDMSADTVKEVTDSMHLTDNDRYLDLDTVTSYSGTAEGLQLYTENGNGYYLEVPQNAQDAQTAIYYVTTKKEYDSLFNALENRNGLTIIEISYGSVLDNEGNGVDTLGYYRHYDNSRFAEGDKIQSVFIYNPDTNFTDDILYRVDTLM